MFDRVFGDFVQPSASIFRDKICKYYVNQENFSCFLIENEL